MHKFGRFIPLLFGIGCFGIGITSDLHAQRASATWSLTSVTTTTVTTSGAVVGQSEFFSTMEINQYTGPNGSLGVASQRVRCAGTNNTWVAETDQVNSRFVQFAVSPREGMKFIVDSVRLDLGVNSTYDLRANIWYSIDSTFANAVKLNSSPLILPNTAMVNPFPLYSINANVEEGKTFYLRIFPWSLSASSGKYICPQNVVISGTTVAISTPAQTLWKLTSTQRADITGLVVASDQVLGAGLVHHSYSYLGTGSGAPNCDRIQPEGFGLWPADPTPSATLYVQYTVRPVVGVTLVLDTVEFWIGADSTSTLRMRAAYSYDSAFASSIELCPDMVISQGTLSRLRFVCNDTVHDNQIFALRIYPHNTQSETAGKYFCIGGVLIHGSTTGIAIASPTVSTITPTYIGTTFLTTGGNVSADGGGAVVARGVCWAVGKSPTVSDSKTVDGAGTGMYRSRVTQLVPNTTYRLRAYATNAAGTAYGTEATITTLAALAVPTLSTSSVSKILATSAQSGGTISSWGGDSVIAKGICWNTTGGPTIANSKTVEGSDIGAFVSVMYGLAPQTKYYVRAYATNSIGTGYGNEEIFSTQARAADIIKIIAADSSGDYPTVQKAFDAVPDFYTGQYTIFLKRGIYKEKLVLGSNKTNVVLRGESRDSTILTYDDYNGKVVGGTTIGTSTSYSVAIDASDFIAQDITFENTSTTAQAVALRVNGDRQSYYNCNIRGYQDTYYAWGGAATGRTYHKNCLIRGSVDFIFGRNTVVFDSCTITINRNTGTLTAASTEASTAFGFVFRDCKITSDSVGFDSNPITSFHLGRPWQAAPRTVFIRCSEPSTLNPAGWLAWNVTAALYAEYKCTGPGSSTTGRISWSSQLTDSAAALYTLENIFAKKSSPSFAMDWMPTLPVPTSVREKSTSVALPTTLELNQNFPNPFNPATVFRFTIPSTEHVQLMIYSLLGQRVDVVVDEILPGGMHQREFDGRHLPSGTYFARLSTPAESRMIRLLLLK